eukprot:jgi/Galph1/3120/GphlegSOOS_G1790.1
MYVFSYGTLKRGFPNSSFMKGTFQGEAITVDRFPLVVGTSMNVPFLLPFPKTGNQVKGEVYDVTEEELEFLDDFEAVNQGLYYRDIVKLNMLDRDSLVNCWAYFRGQGGPTWAASWSAERLLCMDHLKEYTLAHCKYFVPRNQR